MVLCNTLTSKDTGDRRMSWYMLHLVALRETDLSLCPPRWMNITLWAKITLQWILRALYKPVKPVPWTAVKLVFEFETWDCDNGRIDGRPWWQGEQTDQQTLLVIFHHIAINKNTRQLEIQRLPGMNTANLGIISKSCKYFAMYFCFLYALVWLFILILKIWGLNRHNFVAWLTYMVESI